jgi:teichuronic acid exporter
LSIDNQLKNGIKWSVVGQFSTLFFEFVFGIALARILSPSDFGLIAILSVFIMVSQIFINSGLSQSLVRDISASEIDYSTIFFLNIIIGVGAYIILFVIAPIVSLYFSLPDISLLLRIVGISVFLSSLSIVFRAILTKNFKFRAINNIAIITSLTSGIGAIILAFNGAGVWSLIFKTLLNYLLTLLLLVIVTGWFPKFIFSKSSIVKHWSFGKNLLLSGLIGWIYKDVFALMLGRILSIDFLGFYNRSEMLRNLVTNNVESVITSSSYPVLSSMQNDREAFIGLTIKTLKFAFLIVGLSLAFIFSAAVPLIEFILGAKWMYSAKILKYLALAGMVMPLCSIMINAISVYGRSDLYLKLQTYYALYFLSALVFAYKFGTNTFLVSIVMASLASYIHTAFIFCKFFSYSYSSHIKDLIDKIVLIIGVTLSLFTAQLLLGEYNSFIQLISLVLLFSITVLLYFLISRDKEILTIYNSLAKNISFLQVYKNYSSK